MGCCGAPSEGNMEEDGGGVDAGIPWDVLLGAELLIHLSRSVCSLLQEVRELEPRWKRRVSRSRAITMEGIRAAEKEEHARRASPATPLSWSGGGSGTSGSVCVATPEQRRRAKRASGEEEGAWKHGVKETTAGGKRIRALPAKRPKTETCQNEEPAPAALGLSTISGSNKVLAVPAAAGEPASSVPVARVEPFRFRLPDCGVAPVVVGRPGKKKTLAELQAMRESLLQEQEGLRKDLEKQKVMYNAVFEENMRLKSLEASLPSHVESRPLPSYVPSEEAKLEQLQRVESTTTTTAAASEAQTVGGGPSTASVAPGEGEERPEELPQCTAPGRTFLFDLNCAPDTCW